MNNIVYTSSVPTGLSTFSANNKNILKTNLENILADAFKATFIYDDPDNPSEDSEDIAKSFAKTAAGPLSDIIDDYIQNYIKSQLIQLIPQGKLITPVGPLTGIASTLTSDITIT